MAPRTEALAEIPLFALLDEQERAALAERLDDASFPAGTTIFHTGQPGDALYVVRSGEVEIFFHSDTGDRILLETATAGGFFGEISLLDGGPRTASAVVTKDAELLVVDREDLEGFLKKRPEAALDLLAATGRRLRETNRILRQTAAKNINEVDEDTRTPVMKVADWISDFSGSLPFLFIHCVIFFVWIILNAGPLMHTGLGGWDPFPFGLLTMVVSLEAIILSVFVLLSQNRQVARERVRNDIEYNVNLKAELEVAELHRKLDHVQADVLERLARLEKATSGPKPA
jgi:CRP/FNR family transcriptional regulator, cyclic AMP receptor protein